MIYYNDNDSFVIKWLDSLTESGHIEKGVIDDRSIKDVKPDDLTGYEQCHFFAGIGGWPYALAMAGWPRGREVWSGSCPCQPFSTAGKGAGIKDDRHLWPAFRWLIAQKRPATIFGEQVASKSGREWLSEVRADLEAMGYEVGAADLCAAGVGAPHIRQRLFWVANANKTRWKNIARWYGQAEQIGRPKSIAKIIRQWREKWAAEPSMVRVVDGLSPMVGTAVGCFGNAIVPQLAAVFIRAFMDVV